LFGTLFSIAFVFLLLREPEVDPAELRRQVLQVGVDEGLPLRAYALGRIVPPNGLAP
jgi:hypothetical protein